MAFERVIRTQEEMTELGRSLAGLLRQGEAICLSGPLGAGKSTLARGLIRALAGEEEEVPSPTFTLVQFYDADVFSLAHFDLYRLHTPEEAIELGLEEALEDGVVLVEWPERLGARRPPDRLDVVITPEAGEARRVRIASHGALEGRTGL